MRGCLHSRPRTNYCTSSLRPKNQPKQLKKTAAQRRNVVRPQLEARRLADSPQSQFLSWSLEARDSEIHTKCIAGADSIADS